VVPQYRAASNDEIPSTSLLSVVLNFHEIFILISILCKEVVLLEIVVSKA
jgi:hypothetical protein